ncbi:MAG: YHS domain-containing (seleno)protein [Pseudomonadota bacterium]
MRSLVLALTASLAMSAGVMSATSAAAKEEVYQSFFGTAIDGTDPVAYFTEGRPVEGSSEFSHEWNGATWHFSSAENRDMFIAAPERYAPQYGGYCAWAVAQGYTASTDPDAWTIVDGKLYLNYNESIQARWEADIPRFITAANENWPGVLD